MIKAIVTVRNVDGRFMPGEAEEALGRLAEYTTAGLYVVGNTAFRVTSQDAYQISL